MAELPKPPKAYEDFEARYPGLTKAWGQMAEAGADGPLDASTQRLVKLAVAVGAVRQGAVRACARKALAMGIEILVAGADDAQRLSGDGIGAARLRHARRCWNRGR